MNFNNLSKFLKSICKEQEILNYDISVYYNCNNVFYKKHCYTSLLNRAKTLGKNIYFMHSEAKLICCVAIMILTENNKVALDEAINKYLPEFQDNITLKEMICNFYKSSDSNEKLFNFYNMSKLIETISNKPFNEFIHNSILMPLNMKSTSFELNEKNKKHIFCQYNLNKTYETYIESNINHKDFFPINNGYFITTVNDCAKLCNFICTKGTVRNSCKILSTESIDILINDILYDEGKDNGIFVFDEYSNEFIFIDINKKITIVYVQYSKNFSSSSKKTYKDLQKLVYEGTGVNTWSKGYNIFP